MKACFIWKADESEVPATTKIKFVRGATWWMEELAEGAPGHSYDIISGATFSSNSQLYLIQEKAKDWTGSDYLETAEVPYRIILKNNYGSGLLEQFGCWMRYMTEGEFETIGDAEALAVKLNLPVFSSGKKE